jgi:hypothetical protein
MTPACACDPRFTVGREVRHVGCPALGGAVTSLREHTVYVRWSNGVSAPYQRGTGLHLLCLPDDPT